MNELSKDLCYTPEPMDYTKPLNTAEENPGMMDTMPEKSLRRAGSPEFYKMLEQMGEIHERKSHDYASNENPYGNYHFAGKIALLFSHSEQDAGFVGRIAEKIYRLANLENSQKTPSNESIEDTETDICVITLLWMASRRERRNE